MQIDSPVLPPIDPQLKAELLNATEQLMKSINDFCGQNSYVDPRPMNLITYALLSKAPMSITKPLVLETIADLTDKETLRLLAKKEYVHMLSELGIQDKLDVSCLWLYNICACSIFMCIQLYITFHMW